jgi:hypothetical protein
MGAQLFSCLDRLVDSVFTRSECTSSGWDKKGCSIEEVIKEFYSIEEVVFGNELYCFATEFFIVRSRREMWAAIGDKERKFQWLKLMFERRSNVKPWCKCKYDIMYLQLSLCYFSSIKVDCVVICVFSIIWISYLKSKVVG